MTGVGGRPEVIIEGSDNMKDGPWKEYNFLYKPGSVSKSLSFVGLLIISLSLAFPLQLLTEQVCRTHVDFLLVSLHKNHVKHICSVSNSLLIAQFLESV